MSEQRSRRWLRLHVRVLGGAVAISILGTAACGGVNDDAAHQPEGGDPRQLTVFAAASLTDVFEEIGVIFEEERPGTTVRFNFAGSSELAQQINEGAPADVFASANPANMRAVENQGNVVGEEVVFVENALEIAAPPDNPANISNLADLAQNDVVIALCAPEVPCGAAAESVMDASGVDIDPATLEEDVRAALTKVELGEVDAALVYSTDVIVAGEAVQGFSFPESENAINEYPIATLEASEHPELAAEWVRFASSEEAQKVLGDAGFRTR